MRLTCISLTTLAKKEKREVGQRLPYQSKPGFLKLNIRINILLSRFADHSAYDVDNCYYVE